jgi:hypothetical protein
MEEPMLRIISVVVGEMRYTSEAVNCDFLVRIVVEENLSAMFHCRLVGIE